MRNNNAYRRCVTSLGLSMTVLALILSWARADDAIRGDTLQKPEGFGAVSRGGRGGRLVTVTNLADSGTGSLRDALTARGPRIVNFSVAGTIELKSPIRVSSGRLTIAGETAPGSGITLMHHGIHFTGDCDDIVIRHMRIRVTNGGSSGDALLFWGKDGGTIERVLVDHCSLMWATDEVVNTWGKVKDLTCQWTIIAEGQSEADHPKGPHSMGWLSGEGTDRVTIHHCLFAHNGDRSPRVQGGVYDLVNNVIYNWTNHNATKIGGGARVNVVGNSYIGGPQSASSEECILLEDPREVHSGARGIKHRTVDSSGHSGSLAECDLVREGQWELEEAPACAGVLSCSEPIQIPCGRDTIGRESLRVGSQTRRGQGARCGRHTNCKRGQGQNG